MLDDNNKTDNTDEIALLKEGKALTDEYLAQEFFDDWPEDEKREGPGRFLLETAICFVLRKKQKLVIPLEET